MRTAIAIFKIYAHSFFKTICFDGNHRICVMLVWDVSESEDGTYIHRMLKTKETYCECGYGKGGGEDI